MASNELNIYEEMQLSLKLSFPINIALSYVKWDCFEVNYGAHDPVINIIVVYCRARAAFNGSPRIMGHIFLIISRSVSQPQMSSWCTCKDINIGRSSAKVSHTCTDYSWFLAKSKYEQEEFFRVWRWLCWRSHADKFVEHHLLGFIIAWHNVYVSMYWGMLTLSWFDRVAIPCRTSRGASSKPWYSRWPCNSIGRL